MIKHLLAKRLPLCVRAQISLKTCRVDNGEKGLDRVQRATGFGLVLYFKTKI